MITGKDADHYLRLKKKISAKAKELEAMKSEASALQDELIKKFEAGTQRVDGKLGSITLKKDIEGTVKNWDAVYKYILKKKDFSLLQKRLGQAHFRELIEDGVKVPGIDKFHKKSLGVGYKKAVK
jgi:methionyl-tRNA synthetase